VSASGGHQVYLRHPDALRYLDDCERLGVAVTWMEFLRLRDGRVQVVDYAAAPGSPLESVRRARDLVKNGFPEGADVVEFFASE
jgi:hypothetical protein